VLNAAARLVTNTHDQVRPWPVESILHDQLAYTGLTSLDESNTNSLSWSAGVSSEVLERPVLHFRR